MANIKNPRDTADKFYRYKLERLQSKSEGNGTVLRLSVLVLVVLLPLLADRHHMFSDTLVLSLALK